MRSGFTNGRPAGWLRISCMADVMRKIAAKIALRMLELPPWAMPALGAFVDGAGALFGVNILRAISR